MADSSKPLVPGNPYRSLILPDGYDHRLSLRETEQGIKFVKDRF